MFIDIARGQEVCDLADHIRGDLPHLADARATSFSSFVSMTRMKIEILARLADKFNGGR